jgi:mannose-6-phosphate isomerase-like protein (cupin superfamily)
MATTDQNHSYDTFKSMGRNYPRPYRKGIQNSFNCIPANHSCYLAGMVFNRSNISMAIMVYSRMGNRRTVSLPRCVCFQKIREQLKTITMNQQQKAFRRVVTGHDADGKAIIISDAPPVHTQLVGGPGGPTFFEIWHTLETPALIHSQSAEPDENGLVLPPPKKGTRMRVIEFPPEGEEIRKLTGADAAAKFKAMGDEKASTSAEGAPHPLMHRTQTVDYGIVLEGEITLVLDRAESTIQAGDIVIQCGTNHAWANRSGKICRMAFILIDGQFTDEIAQY